MHVYSLQGHPFSRAQRNTSRWPPSAACAHVAASHGHPFARPTVPLSGRFARRRWTPRSPTGTPSRAKRKVSRWPPSAAFAHVISSHGHPFSCAHRSTSRWPPFAAARSRTRPTGTRSDAPTAAPPGGLPPRATASSDPRAPVPARPPKHLQVPPEAAYMHVSSSHGHPFTCAHRSISRCPPFAAYAHVHSFHGHPSRRAHRSTSGGLRAPRTRTSPRSTDTRSDAPTGGPRGGLPAPRTRTKTWAWAPRSCRARASPTRGTPSPRTRTSSGTIRDLSPRRRGSRGASCRGTARGLGGRRRETCRGWSRPCVSRAPRADAASGGPRRVVPRAARDPSDEIGGC